MSTPFDEDPRPRGPRPAPERKGINIWKWACCGCAIVSLIGCVLVVVGIIAGVNWVGEKIDQARQDSASDPVLARLPGGGNVLRVVYSPDGRRIVTMTRMGIVWVLNAETGERVLSIDPGKVSYRSFALSPDGTRLAIGGQTRLASGPAREKVGGATVWDATTGKKLLTLAEGQTDSVGYIAYSLDGTRLATSSGDATVQVWDAITGEKLLDLEGHTEGVLCIGFSPEGSRLVTGSHDGTVRLWDATTGEEVRKIEIKVEMPVGEKDRNDIKGAKPVGAKDLDDVSRAQFSSDGKEVFGVGRSGCWTWDAATGNEIRSIRSQLPVKEPDHIAIHSDTNRLATAEENSVTVRNLTTGEITHQFRIKAGFLLDMSKREVKSVAFSPDGTRVVGGTHDGALWVWKLDN